jgi:hypothetical protein
MEFRIQGQAMRLRAIKTAVAIVQIAICSPAFAGEDSLNFPVREMTRLSAGKSQMAIALLDLPGKGTSGFAWAVFRNDYLLKIEVVDGFPVSVVARPTSYEHFVGIAYRAGANQSVFDLLDTSGGEINVVQAGRISSNLGCVYAEGKNVLAAVSEKQGTYFMDRFQVGPRNIVLLGSSKVASRNATDVMKRCSELSYFRPQ